MGLRRALVWGLVAGLLVVAAAVAWFATIVRSPEYAMRQPGDRVLVVVASREGTDAAQVAQLLGVVDLSGKTLRVGLIDPMTRVALPGTSYDRLRDAYPFGGGEGVAIAWSRHTASRPLPVVTLSEEALVALVDRLGGISVDVPAAANVFDGSRLYTIGGGTQRLSGAEVRALLSAADGMDAAGARPSVRVAVAMAIVGAMKARQPDASDLVERGLATSSLNAADLAGITARARQRAAEATVTPLAR
jgi:hypothetical protein